MIFIKLEDKDGEFKLVPFIDYCEKIGKKNNSVLFKLERYLGIKLLSNDELKEIRDTVLDVSADITRLPTNITMEGDE